MIVTPSQNFQKYRKRLKTDSKINFEKIRLGGKNRSCLNLYIYVHLSTKIMRTEE